MIRPPLFVVAASLIIAGARAQSDSPDSVVTGPTFNDDLAVVRRILDQNGLSDIVETERAVARDGRMVSLDLSNPKLGTVGLTVLPESIGTLTALEKLFVSGNSLKTVPPELAQLVNLTELDLSSNEIAELPAQIGNMTGLRKLDISNNRISVFPESMYSLKKLWYIKAWGNDFVTIPEKIGALTALKELYFQKNKLTSLPLALTKLPNLVYFDYAENSLCKLPAAQDQWLKKKDKLYVQTQKCWK